MSLTITEALAEIKTLNKRLEKKRMGVLSNIARDSRLVDPLAGSGGSPEFVKQERQSIWDLEKRIIAIRTAIQHSNLRTKATAGGVTRTVAEWLTFKREVADSQAAFLNQMSAQIAQKRRDLQPTPSGRNVAIATNSASDPANLTVHMDEKDLLKEQEAFETILGELNGQLSLLNATTTISI